MNACSMISVIRPIGYSPRQRAGVDNGSTTQALLMLRVRLNGNLSHQSRQLAISLR